MNAPRIALVRARYTASGGAERFVANALDALRANGVTITLVTRKWPQQVAGATIVCNPFYIGSVWRDWGFARAVCELFRRERFDLVQSHERIACCDIYRAGDGVHREWLIQRARNWSWLQRAQLALNPYHWYVKYAEFKLFNSAQLKAVVCNSQMVKNEIQRWFGTPSDKLHVIYSGVDTERFHPRLREIHGEKIRWQHNIPHDATIFLYVGSGFERKGVAQLLKAFANLASPSHLIIVGKDKRQSDFERLATTLGISPCTHFLGTIEDVTPYYGAASVFVLPTLYDPFPNVILEAMACGLPVITSTKSGGAELIQEGFNGFVCDPMDIAKLTSNMELLTKADQRRAIGQAARESAEKYTLGAMSIQLGLLYRDLLPVWRSSGILGRTV